MVLLIECDIDLYFDIVLLMYFNGMMFIVVGLYGCVLVIEIYFLVGGGFIVME